MVVTVEANTVFETKLGLKPVDKGLDMATKRRIAEHNPVWAKVLGLAPVLTTHLPLRRTPNLYFPVYAVILKNKIIQITTLIS